MKIPLSWISLYSDISEIITKKSSKEIAHYFSTHAAEIDGIEDIFLDRVVVGKVISCKKHPESKKLSIVEVHVGNENTTILTGAANIIDAKYVAVALVGAVLPGDFTIGERMMAGMNSRGMICSIDELWLSGERAEWIMVLEDYWDTKILESHIGTSFFDLTLTLPWNRGEPFHFSLRDRVFTIDNKSITNRSDLFSIRGNAREFHALFDTPLVDTEQALTLPKDVQFFPVRKDTEKCMSYHLLWFDAQAVEETPFWMRIMMERAGLVPKLDIVDITNMIMIEYGQPLHVFDRDTIVWGITIRMAKKGETLLALNGIEYHLDTTDIVIADEKKILALAGIIGGMDSAINANSRNILFESACFDATTIRLTAQRHALRTDASTRFEKSLDPTLAYRSLSRIIDYMHFLGKNTEFTIFSSQPYEMNPSEIDLTYSFLEWKLGIRLEHATIHAILSKLWFGMKEKSDSMTVRVPSSRATKDIKIKEDIAEEIGRVYWYDSIEEKAPKSILTIGRSDSILSLQSIAIHHFSTRWWDEVYNYSFTNEVLDAKVWYHDQDDAVIVKNAFNQEYTHMRRSLLPRLALNISENIKYRKNLTFFEVGKCSWKKWNSVEETKFIAGISTEYSLEKMRDDIESYLTHTMGNSCIEVKQEWALPFLHPNACGIYTLNGVSVWHFGRIHPVTATEFDIPEDTLYFELALEPLVDAYNESEIVFREIGKYQSIPRELNFILPEKTSTGQVATTLSAVHPWIGNVQISSIFLDDEKVWKEKKAVTFSFTLENTEATISDSDALEVQNLIIDKMKQNGYELKGPDL